MSDGSNTPGQSNAPSEEALRRPMGGFSPSSPDYRPLPPLNLPQVQIPPAGPPPQPRPAGSVPPAQPERLSAPSSSAMGPPTLPDGVPTPGRIPAYPAYRPVPAPAYPSRPLAAQAPPPYPPTYPPYGPPGRARPDNTAVVIEALGAVFGIFGLGWMMAGRTSTGILLLLGGLAWDAIAIAGIHLTLGVGACCFLPVHAVFITLSTVLLSNYIKSMG